MAIEFQCTSCQRQLRVGDALGGKRGKCPHCGSLVQVPVASTARPSANAPQSQSVRGAAAQGGNVMVTCPSCRQSIMAPASLIGQQGACPHCQAVMIVGGGAAQSPQISPQAPSPSGYSPAPNPGLDPFGGGYSPLGGGNDLFGGMPAYSPPSAPSPYGSAAPANDPFGYSQPAPSWGGAPVGNPYATSGPSGYSSGYGRRSSSGQWAPVKLMVPAILNIVLIAPVILWQLYMIVEILFADGPRFSPDPQRELTIRIVAALFGAFFTLLNAIIVLGMSQMIILRRFELARIGAIIACIPCSYLCLNMILGGWVLFILLQPDVRKQFR
jgi:predicted RNA-binding Zn-ribbon protein involved in translation (DUF1610 family)